MNSVDKYVAIRIYEMDEEPDVQDLAGHMILIGLSDLSHIIVAKDAWKGFSSRMRAALSEGDNIIKKDESNGG